jgi:diguanylate cyclase (GGDEF)-like protein
MIAVVMTGLTSTIWSAFFLNFCILTTSGLLMGLTFQWPWFFRTSIFRSVLHAFTSAALFIFTFPAGPHLFIDLRLVPVALAAYRLGPGWALLAALPVTLYRCTLGGPALPGTLAHLALVLIAASLLRHPDAVPTLSQRENLRRALLIFALPALTVFPTFVASGRGLSAALLPYVLVTFLSVAGFALWYSIVRVMTRTFERAARFEAAATVDRLTGLPNRFAFERDQRDTAEWASRYMMFLDLDRFKAINDRYGHDFGDQVLQAFGQVMVSQLGDLGRVYRLGGEEFVVRFGAPDIAGAQHLADRLRRELPHQISEALGRWDVYVTVSGGLVADGPDTLKGADQLMYAAKQLGRNRIHDQWQAVPAAPSNSPLNETSPALNTLRALLRYIAGNDEQLEPNLQGLLDAAISCVPGAQAGSISVRHAGHSEVRVQSGFSDELLGTRHSYQQMLLWHGDPVAWQAGRARIVTGEVLRRRSRVPYPTDDDYQTVLLEAGRQQHLQSNLFLPIRVQGDIYAELNLDNLNREDAFDLDSLAIAEEFGLWVAAIFSASSRVKQALNAQSATLMTLGIALEARDMETQGHTQRVIELSQALGKELGLDAATVETLRQGAALHDLGKLLVPDHILLKPGKLDPDEWAIMKTHAELGETLAEHLSELMPGVLGVIRSHHERWDGKGYPDGRLGQDIPLLARIFSVCDVYDALTSVRPYKAAWTRTEALQEIRKQAGVQFDPQVVQAFLALHAEVSEVDSESPSSGVPGPERHFRTASTPADL